VCNHGSQKTSENEITGPIKLPVHCQFFHENLSGFFEVTGTRGFLIA
jgi:hypothetical protein